MFSVVESITKVVRRLVDMYNRSGSRTASQESMDHSTPGEKGGGGYSTNLSGPVITGGDENPQDGGVSEDTIYYSDLSTYCECLYCGYLYYGCLYCGYFYYGCLCCGYFYYGCLYCECSTMGVCIVGTSTMGACTMSALLWVLVP